MLIICYDSSFKNKKSVDIGTFIYKYTSWEALLQLGVGVEKASYIW